MPNNKVYFQFKSNLNKLPDEPVYMSDIITTSGQESITNTINKLPIFPNGINNAVRVSAIDIVYLIDKELKNSDISVYPIGVSELLLEPKQQHRTNRFLGHIKLLFALLLLFFGSGLAIMYFHSDVDMKGTHSQLYYLLSGERRENPIVFSIPYSIGVGVGIAVYFKIYGRKNKKNDPGPLELEFHQNKKELQDYLKSLED
ncbi:MAG TPA: stage V sporulation protein AA [Bacillota bacterium]|nr:stage V sporulation protein AA [Bacillota bacterium]